MLSPYGFNLHFSDYYLSWEYFILNSYIFFVCELPYHGFVHFSKGCRYSLYILDLSPLLDVVSKFSPSLWLIFLFSLWYFQGVEVINFNEVKYIYFFLFSLCFCVFQSHREEEFIVKGKILKLLKENIEYLYDLRIGKDFLNKIQKGLMINHCYINKHF